MSKMPKVTTWISNTLKMRLKNASEKTNLPMSRIVALCLDAEFERNPGLTFDLDMPNEYVEYAFANEAGKILDYIKKNLSGAPFASDLIYILRHDIGVTDKDILFGAFKELIEKNFIVPAKSSDAYPKKYQQYELPKDIKRNKEDRDYAKYMRLKEKFEKNQETK